MINKSQAHNLYLDSVAQSPISGFRCFIIGVVHMFLKKKALWKKTKNHRRLASKRGTMHTNVGI